MTSSSPSIPAPKSKSRITALDMSRVFAALFVIIEHATTDQHGKPFPEFDALEKALPLIGRVISNAARSEFFFVTSLFLLAVSVERFMGSYGEQATKQAKRLLLPFLVWTGVYLVFRSYKADGFGYGPGLWGEAWIWEIAWYEIWQVISSPIETVKVLVLGTSKYHMHFLPMLFVLTLFYPIYKVAEDRPWLGLMIIPLLLMKNQFDVFIYSNFWVNGDKTWWFGKEYWSLETLRFVRSMLIFGVKALTYTGYGIAMFAIYGIVQKDVKMLRPFLPVLSLILGLFALAFVAHGMLFFVKGAWVNPTGLIYLPYYTIGLVIVLTLLAVSYWPWPPIFSRLAPYSFGTYLVHPIVIDVFDVWTKGWGWSVPAYSSAKMIVAVAFTVLIVAILSKLPFWAWSMGLKRKKLFEL